MMQVRTNTWGFEQCPHFEDRHAGARGEGRGEVDCPSCWIRAHAGVKNKVGAVRSHPSASISDIRMVPTRDEARSALFGTEAQVVEAVKSLGELYVQYRQCVKDLIRQAFPIRVLILLFSQTSAFVHARIAFCSRVGAVRPLINMLGTRRVREPVRARAPAAVLRSRTCMERVALRSSTCLALQSSVLLLDPNM